MTRTLFIGLDGATFTVLNEMTRDLPGEGITMPFLKKFLENGVRAKLRSTPNPLTPPAWVSIQTGRNPGEHGIYDFVHTEEKGRDIFFTLNDFRNIDTETIWSILGRQDKSYVALNFPVTAPPKGLTGVVVPGFVSWKHLRRNVSPENFYERLKNIPDFDPKELAWDFEQEGKAIEIISPEDMESWISYHLPREEQWFRISEMLMKEDNPDFMAVLFDGTDKIQHQAWKFLDPALLPENPSPWETRMRALCLKYFRQLDGYIEALVTLAGPDAQVFMASDHGFTTTTEVIRINSFLAEKGYLIWKEDDGTEQSKRRDASNFANVDWDQTLAYCRTPSSNGITIRVAEKSGDPGIKPENYESFRTKLILDLESFVDEENGERIIVEIMKREDVFPGKNMKNAPDLTLMLRDNGFVSVRSTTPPLWKRDMPAGTHHPDGVFLAGGYGIRQGVETDLKQIVDVAPTFLYSQGLPIPSDFEGTIPQDFFTEEYWNAQPPRTGPATLSIEQLNASPSPSSSSEDATEEDKAKIIAQLQMLGYME